METEPKPKQHSKMLWPLVIGMWGLFITAGCITDPTFANPITKITVPSDSHIEQVDSTISPPEVPAPYTTSFKGPATTTINLGGDRTFKIKTDEKGRALLLSSGYLLNLVVLAALGIKDKIQRKPISR